MAEVTFPELIPEHKSSGESVKSGALVEYYGKLAQWCDAAHEEALGAQQDIPELKEMSSALDYLSGLQWKETMPSYRAKPVSNEILSQFWETVGLLTDIKPMFKITDIGGSGEYSKTQSLLNKMAKGWAGNGNFERTLAFCTMFGTLTTAPAKVYWNPFARGHSGDPSDGDISFESLSISSVLRLGIQDWDIQNDECVIYRRTRTLDWIKRAFPRMGKLVKAEEAKSKYTVDVQSPVTVMPSVFQNLSPGMKRMMGAGDRTSVTSVYPKAEVREFWKRDDMVNTSPNKIWVGPEGSSWGYWVSPGQKMYPRGRLIIRANGVTLYDEPNPYFHRRYPFALLGLNAVPWQEYAMSLISPWMKQQDILNQILAGVIQCVKKAINPALMASKSAINPEAMRAIDSSKPNLKITYSQNASSPPIWQAPPNVPAYVLQTYGLVQKSMQQSSGAAAVGDAAGKKQVPGGDTLDKITFAKNTPIRMMGRNLEGFVDEVGSLWTATALQFYDAGRRMELLGEQGMTKEDTDDTPGSLIPHGINSEAFVRRWQLKCDKGTLLNVQRQDKIQIAFGLRKGRDLSRNKLFEILDWNLNLKENEDELIEEAKKMAALAPPPKGHK
jgi:hypothetical protein